MCSGQKITGILHKRLAHSRTSWHFGFFFFLVVYSFLHKSLPRIGQWLRNHFSKYILIQNNFQDIIILGSCTVLYFNKNKSIKYVKTATPQGLSHFTSVINIRTTLQRASKTLRKQSRGWTSLAPAAPCTLRQHEYVQMVSGGRALGWLLIETT